MRLGLLCVCLLGFYSQFSPLRLGLIIGALIQIIGSCIKPSVADRALHPVSSPHRHLKRNTHADSLAHDDGMVSVRGYLDAAANQFILDGTT